MNEEKLRKEEREMLDSLGTMAGMPSLGQAKIIDEFMIKHCEFYDNKSEYDPICKLSKTRCDHIRPSTCLYRRIYKDAYCKGYTEGRNVEM